MPGTNTEPGDAVEVVVVVDVLVFELVFFLPFFSLFRRAGHNARELAMLCELQGRGQQVGAVIAKTHQRYTDLVFRFFEKDIGKCGSAEGECPSADGGLFDELPAVCHDFMF